MRRWNGILLPPPPWYVLRTWWSVGVQVNGPYLTVVYLRSTIIPIGHHVNCESRGYGHHAITHIVVSECDIVR